MWWLPWIGIGRLADRSLVDESQARAAAPARTEHLEHGHSWDQLVEAWSVSTSAIVQARTTEARLEAVVRRAAILDELERRNPRAFRAWVAGELTLIGLYRTDR